MPVRLARTLGLLAISAAVLSCHHEVTGPDTPGLADDFSLLIERRIAGQRSFYTLGARTSAVAPFTGVPIDARTLIPSPDGRTIAYLREVDGLYGLWAMDRDGANRRPILDGGSISIESAAWSSDGKKLTFAYSSASTSNDIGVVNADGTGMVDLTPDPLPGIWIDRDPTFSPDRSRIAFSSNRSGTQRIWVMNADGSNPVFVTANNPSGQERQPVWSPDGSFLAFVATTAAGRGIAFTKLDGSEYKHVPIAPAPIDPVWLPDGRLVYVSNPNGNFDVFALDRTAGFSTPLTSRKDDDFHAAVLTNVAPFEWLGFASPVVTNINRPTAIDLDAADVITDGFNDLLILSPILNEAKLMRGTPAGALQQIGSLFVETNVAALATGFVSVDQAPDIVGRGDSAAYLWRGRTDGPGISTRIPLNGEVRDVVLADADMNGRLDIVSLVENGTQPFRIVTHTVNASDVVVSSANVAATQKSGKRMCAGDLDDDGRADLTILAGTSSLTPLVAYGKGDLAFPAPVAAGTAVSTDLTAIPFCVDLNRDGRTDLALVSLGQASGISVNLFNGSTFGPSTKIAVSPGAVVPVDIDRDGDMDFIVGSSTTAELFVIKNRGDGRFTIGTPIALENIPLQVTAADFNGDNWPDVAIIDAMGALVMLMSKGR